MNCLMVPISIFLCLSWNFKALGNGSSRTILYDATTLNKQAEFYEQYEFSNSLDNAFNNSQNDSFLSLQSEECDDFYNWEYPWERDFGDEKFGASLKMKNHVKYDCTHVEAGASSQAKGVVFEKNFSLAKANVQAWANDNEMVLATSLYVLGFEVHQSRIEKTGSLSISGFPHHPIQETASYSTMIGPVPVTLKYGVVGKVGVEWQARLGPFSAEVTAKPLVDVDSYVRGGVAVKEVLELKIEGSLNVLDSSYKMQSGIATISVENKPSLEAQSSINGSLAMLDGDISGEIILLDKDAYRKQFFSWDGYSLNGVLAKHQERIVLSDPIPFRLE